GDGLLDLPGVPLDLEQVALLGLDEHGASRRVAEEAEGPLLEPDDHAEGSVDPRADALVEVLLVLVGQEYHLGALAQTQVDRRRGVLLLEGAPGRAGEGPLLIGEVAEALGVD